jgi:hypothetical protein
VTGSQERRAKSEEPRAKSQERRAKSGEPRAKSGERRAESARKAEAHFGPTGLTSASAHMGIITGSVAWNVPPCGEVWREATQNLGKQRKI